MRSPEEEPVGATGVGDTELRVGPDAAHVSQARRFAVEVTARLGADDDAQDAVRTLVSELVTNVVLHAGTDAVVRVVDVQELLRVDVLDGSPAPPLQRRVDGASTTGRGLRLLRTLSVDSGIVADSTVAPSGKRVWFTIAKSGGEDARTAVAVAAFDLFGADLEGAW